MRNSRRARENSATRSEIERHRICQWMHNYRISGLTVASELDLPVTIFACANNERPDVTDRRVPALVEVRLPDLRRISGFTTELPRRFAPMPRC
jgi:hypothetical protein